MQMALQLVIKSLVSSQIANYCLKKKTMIETVLLDPDLQMIFPYTSIMTFKLTEALTTFRSQDRSMCVHILADWTQAHKNIIKFIE